MEKHSCHSQRQNYSHFVGEVLVYTSSEETGQRVHSVPVKQTEDVSVSHQDNSTAFPFIACYS